MKFAVCNEIFQGWPPERVFRFAAETGYDAVEIAPFTLAPLVGRISGMERTRLRTEAERAGIRISGIHWVLMNTPGPLGLTHPDPAVRAATSDYLGELADFCADIGGAFMVVGSPKQRNVPEGVSLVQARAWAAECFRRPLERAEQRGVVICIEPLAPSETNFINTAEEAAAFAAQFRSPAFQIILDVKAMSSEAKPVPQIIRESKGRFAYFHANDANLKGPGFGDVDFKPIAAALKETGYDGYVSVEVFRFEEGPETIARKSLEYLKSVF